MAAYAAFKHVELYNIGSGKRRVLKPPGGGSSDIFAGDVASTPRSMKNHMKSNIFQAPSPGANGTNGEGRRPYVNSHNRLFGDNERSALTPAKNHMKSNIPLGNGKGGGAGAGDEADCIKMHSNGAGHVGGSYDQISNENGFNGKNNGGGDYNECHHSHAAPNFEQPHISKDMYKAAHYLNPTYNSKINLCINDDYISVIDNDNSHNSSYSHNVNISYESKESERESNELDENMNLINAIDSNNHNRVPKNLAAVSDTSSKSVGALDNNVILKNRVPPGGYSSTLW